MPHIYLFPNSKVDTSQRNKVGIHHTAAPSATPLGTWETINMSAKLNNVKIMLREATTSPWWPQTHELLWQSGPERAGHRWVWGARPDAHPATRTPSKPIPDLKRQNQWMCKCEQRCLLSSFFLVYQVFSKPLVKVSCSKAQGWTQAVAKIPGVWKLFLWMGLLPHNQRV